MFSRRMFFWPTKLVLASVISLCSLIATAQSRGEHAGPGGIPGGAGRPYGIDEKDSLKDFHQSMAVQATSEQIAEFRTLVKSIDEAKSKLQAFEQQKSKPDPSKSDPNKPGPASEAAVSGSQLDQTLENIRAASKKFVDGFFDKQKSGLKDLIKRLLKADSDLEIEEKKLDQSVQVGNGAGPEAAAHAESLDKALADFSNQQLALGREMGIVLASGNDVTFTFVPVKSTAKIGNQTTAVNVTGALSQTSAQGGQRTFKLEMVADLLDLQQNITQLLRPQIEKASGCGERLALRQASIAPASPASILTLQLHYERWSCRGSISSELAEGEGSVEVKLTPAVEKSNSLKLTAEFSRINASGMMGDSLRSGDLGDDLRDRVSQSILSVMQAGVDFKATLPPAVQNSAVVQSVKFQDPSAGRLTVVLDGQMEVSNDQVNLMASQLNQSLGASGTASR
jgi:hypothetical protein